MDINISANQSIFLFPNFFKKIIKNWKLVVPSLISSFRKWRAPKVDFVLVFLFDQSRLMEVVYWVPVSVTGQLNVVRLPVFNADVKVSAA